MDSISIRSCIFGLRIMNRCGIRRNASTGTSRIIRGRWRSLKLEKRLLRGCWKMPWRKSSIGRTGRMSSIGRWGSFRRSSPTLSNFFLGDVLLQLRLDGRQAGLFCRWFVLSAASCNRIFWGCFVATQVVPCVVHWCWLQGFLYFFFYAQRHGVMVAMRCFLFLL